MAGIIADISQYLSVQENLRALNAQIMQLEDMMRADSDVARAIGYDVTSLRRNYEQAASRYIDLYRAATGTVPSGLTGLGLFPVLPAWAAVTIAIVAAGVVAMLSYAAVLYEQAQNILAQKQQTVAQSQSSLISQAQDADTQANAADQRGESESAAQLRAQANALRAQASGLTPGTTSGDTLTFIQNNWPWLLLAGGAAFYAIKA